MSNDVIALLAVDIKVGDTVAVFADVNGECCKGQCDRFEGERVFVGNGRFVMERLEVFKRDPSTIRCVGVSVRCVGVPVRCVGVSVIGVSVRCVGILVMGVSVRCVGVPVRCVGVPVRCVGVSVIGVSVRCVGVSVQFCVKWFW